MAVVLANKREKEAVEMRAALCETLMELAGQRKDIAYLDADLFGSSGMKKFAAAYPDRAYDVGIAEANMIGIAAGLSATGMTPFVHTFGPFATRRCFDQLFLSVAYGRNTVNVIGSDPGITAVGMFRTMPTSSNGMWVPPLNAAVTPASEPTCRWRMQPCTSPSPKPQCWTPPTMTSLPVSPANW